MNGGKKMRGARSGWRFFPWVICAGLGVVVLVNVGMVWAALRFHPGAAGGNGFGLSNGYNRVLAEAEREASLGWTLSVTAVDGRPVLLLRDREGHALEGARIELVAQRPVGPPMRTLLRVRPEGDGRYVADEFLRAPGQWDFLVTATVEPDKIFSATRRVVAR
jgi:nitrogen fixation protein FixH